MATTTIHTNTADRDQLGKYIHELMDIISSVGFEDRKFTENEFLELMNNMKRMNELKEIITTNTIYITIEKARARQPAGPPKPKPSLSQKLVHPDYGSCERCDRVVLKKKLERHQTTAVCCQIYQSKTSTKITEVIHSDWHQIQQVLARQAEVDTNKKKELMEPYLEDREQPAINWVKGGAIYSEGVFLGNVWREEV